MGSEPIASKYAVFDRSRLARQAAGRARQRSAFGSLAGARRPRTALRASAICPRSRARLAEARRRGAARILMMGAHVLRAGVNRHIIDLVERGFIDHIAMNGAGSDPRLRAGAHRRDHRERGALHPHRRIRPVARDRRAERLGRAKLPHSVWAWAKTSAGASTASDYPHKDLSVLAAAYRLLRSGDGARRHRLRHSARASRTATARRSARPAIAIS